MADIGRPAGTLKTPELSHQQELLAWLKVMRSIREMVERQLALFSQQIEDVEKHQQSFSIDSQLAIMAGLKDLLATSSKAVESGLKTATGGANDKHSEDPESFMRTLEGGKGA